MPASWNERGFQLRTIGLGHRLDGLSDLLSRAWGCSVFDVGCNRGRVAYEFERYGANTIHGCDHNELGMTVANEWFADLRGVRSRFEVVDLTGGMDAIKKAFGLELLPRYDFVLMLAVFHKLERAMPDNKLLSLVEDLGYMCGRYFVWRGSREEKPIIELALPNEFRLVHYSEISEILFEGKHTPQPCAVWQRG